MNTRIVGLVLLLSFQCCVQAANFYRYKNDQGNLVLEDKIPAKFVKKGYQVVDETGRVLKTVRPTRTEEEKKRDLRLQERKKQQDRIAREQESNDQVLLKTFSNADDIIRVRDNKLKALDSNIEIVEGTIARTEKKLSQLLVEAANQEKQGKEVSVGLLSDIDDLQEQIDNNQAYIEEKAQEKIAIKIKAEVDHRRYKQLVGDHSSEVLTTEVLRKDDKALTYHCSDDMTCNKAWTVAQIFVQDNATTPIQLVSNTLIATAKPQNKTDISLAVTRMSSVSGIGSLTVEAHCHLSDFGEELCESQTVKHIQKRFFDTLVDKLGESYVEDAEDNEGGE